MARQTHGTTTVEDPPYSTLALGDLRVVVAVEPNHPLAGQQRLLRVKPLGRSFANFIGTGQVLGATVAGCHQLRSRLLLA